MRNNPKTRCDAARARRAVEYLVALAAAGACAPQSQDEIQQLRADLSALSHEVEAIKAKVEAAPSNDSEPAAPATAATAPEPPKPQETWTQQFARFQEEKVDKPWAHLRQAPLLRAATEHIKATGTRLHSVTCKTTACLVVVQAPQKPRRPYQPMKNPWAETEMTAHAQPIYGGKTRWSYLLSRHSKDNPEAGEARVDPLELAKSKGAGTTLLTDSDAAATSSQESAQTTADKTAPAEKAEATPPESAAESAESAEPPPPPPPPKAEGKPAPSPAASAAAAPSAEAKANPPAAAPSVQPRTVPSQDTSAPSLH